MKKSFLLILVGLLFLSFIIFIWTVFPSGQSEISYRLHSNTFLSPEESRCDFSDFFYEAEFVVQYPKVLDMMESGKILITFVNSTPDRREQLNHDVNTCSMILEIWIDTQDLFITPGNRSFQMVTANPGQNFIFEISPLSEHENKGAIWIFAQFSELDDVKPVRIPLFQIPFAIQSRSFFGVAPKTIRIYCLSFILLSSISLVLLLKWKD